MEEKNIPLIHEEAWKWIADRSQKPFRPKDIYRGGNVPQWLRDAIEKGFVNPNSQDVYTVILEEDEVVDIEVSQDRSLVKEISPSFRRLENRKR